MRRTASPAITAQMYRHFAVVTLALTALMAFFADGEKQQALAAEAMPRHSEKLRRAAPKELGPLAPTRAAADVPRGTWGSDDSGGFGQPMLHVSSTSTWVPSPSVYGGDARPDGAVGVPISGLDERDDAATDQTISAPPSATQIAAAAAASRLRSGSAGRD
jgi:hypothetical protein